ncbi:MAG: hypothetical protein SFY80_01775 [Verrucomicrobiota bacterium]|nr:hypothetical protein [Verrucomicrobiota bacterium]
MLLRLVLVFGLVGSLTLTAQAQLTINWSADADRKLADSAGNLLAPGNQVEIGALDDQYYISYNSNDLFLVRKAWSSFGTASITASPFLGDAGRFATTSSRDSWAQPYQPIYLLVYKTADAGPPLNDLSNVQEFGLYTRIDFLNPTWTFPAFALAPLTLSTVDVNTFYQGTQNSQAKQLRTAPYNPMVKLERLWGTYADLGNGWRWSLWFSYFWNGNTYPWVWHHKLGWVYIFGEESESVWMWNPKVGWIWTGSGFYPYSYVPSISPDLVHIDTVSPSSM